MNKPLKGKGYVRNFYSMEHSANGGWFYAQDVKSALALFKEKLIEAGLHQRKPISVISFNKIYAECFPDLCHSGDSIRYKRNPQWIKVKSAEELAKKLGMN